MMTFDHDRAERLWMDGLLDSEIAKALGVESTLIYKWRQKNDYPTNKGLFSWDPYKKNYPKAKIAVYKS